MTTKPSGRSRRAAQEKMRGAAPSSAATAQPATTRGRRAGRAGYHHGDLKVALIAAAERILARDGIQGLTLRATAREAGVSHAAPKNHFGDVRGLLSELAAVGFERLNDAMAAAMSTKAPPGARMGALGAAYVRFARANPGLFLLMFRGERLDFRRPALCSAADAALDGLLRRTGGPPFDAGAGLTLAQAAQVARQWALVHGLSLLLIDGRLSPILEKLPGGIVEADVIEEIFAPARAV